MPLLLFDSSVIGSCLRMCILDTCTFGNEITFVYAFIAIRLCLEHTDNVTF